jgi:signal transduction histidine kinase
MLSTLRTQLRIGPFDWHAIEPWHAVRLAFGVLAPLVFGWANGQIEYGVFAALGALSAGFAAYHGVTRSRMAAILVASVGMAVTTFVGATTAATLPWLLVLVVAILGYVTGLAVALGPLLSVAILQWSVGLLVAVGLPQDPAEAGLRAGLVLAGGLVQALLVAGSWTVRPGMRERMSLAETYRALAAYASSLAAGKFGPPPPIVFPATSALDDVNPLLSAAKRLMFFDLLEEAERLRAAMAAVAVQAGSASREENDEIRRVASETITTLELIVGALNASRTNRADRAHDLTRRVAGQPVTMLFPPHLVDEEPRILESIRRGEKIDHYETVRRRKDGTEINISLTISPIRDDAGNVVGASKIARDITAAKQAEEALARAQAELAHVTRVATLGEMTASIAHEINQPLGAITNNANATLRWLAANNLDEARRSVEVIRADGHRAGEIIQRIRSFATKGPPEKSWTDINQTIRDVIALARSELQRNNVALETRFSDDVDHVPLIFGDRIQLQQVILNLIMNAVEAMGEMSDGPRELLIRTGTDASEAIVVSVRDSGPGLGSEKLDRLFTPFYTTKPQGMGMGLAICRSIVEAHGGRLWATAKDDGGATFQFTLPSVGDRVATSK